MADPIKVFINRDQNEDGSFIYNFGDELGAEILRKLGYNVEEVNMRRLMCCRLALPYLATAN